MGVGSFGVDFDELGYYATAGMDRMLAMGRGINMAFRIAFQELGGIWAALGDKMYSLLGNANFTAGMRQQDSGRTWEWLQKTAGQAWVTQATSFQGGMDGGYREGHTADLRQVNRVDWKDYQNLLPGEAVVLLGGRRIYARLFHHPLEITGRPRLCRTLMLAPPDVLAVRVPLDRIARVRARVVAGLPSDEPDVPASGVLEALIPALAGAAAKGATVQGCIGRRIRGRGPGPQGGGPCCRRSCGTAPCGRRTCRRANRRGRRRRRRCGQRRASPPAGDGVHAHAGRHRRPAFDGPRPFRTPA